MKQLAWKHIHYRYLPHTGIHTAVHVTVRFFQDMAVSDTFLCVCLSGILCIPFPHPHMLHTYYRSALGGNPHHHRYYLGFVVLRLAVAQRPLEALVDHVCGHSSCVTLAS